ncbi:hypothetical protein TSOC_005387 [Tetrabaena socialis]|uniref:SAM domain-containing protein n=1 Tax=Tetrabaena socialis TaxID=47790 RepID=A0A2J8A6D4_9CHLO|nr:hypothetical protein TSOC_005387 [Tetrabaena socialis]|eukprot:PNH08092.1 hypothetical protein TSOC_005387 [Tetrabaena socialis]
MLLSPTVASVSGSMRYGRPPCDVRHVHDVAAWVEFIGLGQYRTKFVHHSVDGKLLLALGEAELVRDLRVLPLGHRRGLLGAIAELKEAAAEMEEQRAKKGLPPGVAPEPKNEKERPHAALTLRQLVRTLRLAHSCYYKLLKPVQLEPLATVLTAAAAATAPTAPTATAAAEGAGGGGGGGAEGGAGGQRGARQAGARTPLDHAAVLEGVRVVLTAAMDAGEVASIHGHYRPDAGHLVVLDGLLTEGEREELLAWLTAPGHDHAGPPPEDKWEMACVDREGDRATWGLQPQLLAALRDAPPPPVLALQTRLAALYPEYDICHMPADQISESGGGGGGDSEEEGAADLSSFVGNAVMAGDSCAWHVDADPSTIPPYSPWVHNFGFTAASAAAQRGIAAGRNVKGMQRAGLDVVRRRVPLLLLARLLLLLLPLLLLLLLAVPAAAAAITAATTTAATLVVASSGAAPAGAAGAARVERRNADDRQQQLRRPPHAGVEPLPERGSSQLRWKAVCKAAHGGGEGRLMQ